LTHPCPCENPSTDLPTSPDDFRTGRVITISAAHGVHDIYTAFLPSLMPIFISTLMLSKTEAGLLNVFLQVPSLLQPVIGHLADRVSLRYLVILAPAVSAAFMSLLPVAPGYGALTLFLLLAGLSSASIHSVGPVMAGRLSGPHLGRGMGFWMVGGELGRTLGPIVIVGAIQLLTVPSTPLVMVAGLLTSVVLFLLLRDVAGRPVVSADSLPWREALHSLGPLLVPLTGVIIVRSFVVSALTTYLPTFLSEGGSGLVAAGASLSLLQAAGVGGALLGGSVSDRVGRRTILFLSFLVTPLLMGAFLLVDGWMRIPLLLLLGVGSLSVGPVIMALVQESLPGNRALANGLYMALSFVLRSGVIVVIGLIGDALSLRWAFAVSAAMGVVGLPFVSRLPGASVGSKERVSDVRRDNPGGG